jgi:hypothetical protein
LGAEGPFIFVVLGVIALVCGFLAAAISRFLPEQVCFGRRFIRIVMSSTLSVLPIFSLAVLMAASYGWSDPLYVFGMLLPAFLLCSFIAVFVSAPAAWLVSRSRRRGASADIFE